MGLFNDEQSLKARAKRDFLTLIEKDGDRFLGDVVEFHDRMFNAFWNGTAGLTPDEAAEALAYRGQQCMGLLLAVRGFVDAIEEGRLTQTLPREVVPGPDGTITLRDWPPPEVDPEPDPEEP